MPQPPQPAIFFHPDAIESKGKELVGRRSSGQSFLKGFLAHVPGDIITAVTEGPNGAKAFETVARQLGETREIRTRTLRGQKGFLDAGAVFFPGPGYMGASWRRQRFDPTAGSLIGVTHTMSTRRVIESLHTLLAEPVEPWDAIICTSHAVKSVVQTQMDLEVAYYRSRFGASRVPVPQLPVIPLGIHVADFERCDKARMAMRAKFDTPEDATVVMTMGRFTSVEKANPVPMFLALEQAAQATGKPVHLWMVGWSNREAEMVLHVDGAAALCPSVVTHVIDGRAPEVRRDIWSGADIFTLPVDNIQETFGLVPVEAMAAGLPVVMPDWNGFKDTVVHGQTGFLIPTMMPAGGAGPLIAQRYADGTDDYLRYLSIVQQQTAIDVPQYAHAFEILINDPEKRRAMGAAGRQHAARTFDWSAVIPQYLDLATELALMRKGATSTTPRLSKSVLSPIEVDPFTLYRGYVSGSPTAQSVVTHRRVLTAADLAALDKLNGRDLYGRRIVADETVLRICALLEIGMQMTIGDISAQTELGLGVVTASILFLAKFDYVIISGLQPN